MEGCAMCSAAENKKLPSDRADGLGGRGGRAWEGSQKSGEGREVRWGSGVKSEKRVRLYPRLAHTV